MWTGEFLHPLEGGLVQFQLQAECLGYRFVCDIIVATRKGNVSVSSYHKQTNNTGLDCTDVGPMPPLVTTKS